LAPSPRTVIIAFSLAQSASHKHNQGQAMSGRLRSGTGALDKETFVLVLQGGGALGAYQAGAYEALDDAGLLPDWVAGISIGAINGAIIAGNPPQARVAKLRAFWEQTSSWLQGDPAIEGTHYREFFNYVSAATVSAVGVPGFFEPRIPPASMMPPGSPAALSIYDSGPLKGTLETLVDFAYLKHRQVRLSVGAVNIRTGNFVYFDSYDEADIAPEHIMASGALPPGLPPIIIDGEPYWDGGLVSNTPLQYVLDYTGDTSDKCIFQIDLFSARGTMPQTLLEVAQRAKEIRFSSRTRLNTDAFRETQTIRRALRRLLDKIPAPSDGNSDWDLLQKFARDSAVTIVHLIYRRAAYDTHAQDFEYSRFSVEEHWSAGRNDMRRTLRHRQWRERVKPRTGVRVLDLAD
jgi:NTE family protein